MNTQEALKAFEVSGGRSIIVASKGGTQYWLDLDVVQASSDEYVYGTFVNKNQRRKCDYRWFFLKNVKLA